ncbi:MAG: DMT(drug/metabolite transporter) superfamily permease [Firmicutes bacterium]|nr:DMT(drug/metabolite transporter) superfamily permease [Bacillota bacterium]
MKEWKGPFFLFCAFSLAGTSVISARFVSGKLGTFTITAVSLLFALLILLPPSWKKLAEVIRITPARGYLVFLLQAFFGIFLFRLFLLSSLLYTSTGEAGILTGATPAITALLAIAILKEPVNEKKLAGIFSTVAGILLIQGLLSAGSLSLKHLGGNVLVLCAAACESVFNILSRIFAIKTPPDQRNPVSPLVQTTIVTVIALLLCLIPALSERPAQLLAAAGWKEWLALLWYGMFVTALAFMCWYAGIKRCDAITAAAYSGIMPFTAMLLSAVILGEHAGWQQWSGGILVIIGMVLIGSSNAPSADTDKNLDKYTLSL